mmetsp:Transcript_11845/g.36108  ORF Transcript_11845/g.36108 Transcript_11845/m.36108 type:complete len:272 (+) Transcript_11845:125-940(+)|eukprot:CAMPEP_0198725744 /NCGR_PEP_ID=MMETSP1475-20131203/2988_1 /TAXON_ID= ORGANISM="Unidentified sp., Strain CCMP1999" /NCGR_SAMPLE_ID=MMETSP1475 /ASSEMBLY_ACC=CAM_ASM_001111 /LENGTH=271 /DNA_ID=CAMNT_0044487567 /DNA_START=137 /DNA_END=952 /DNA_ORIENTATION=+
MAFVSGFVGGSRGSVQAAARSARVRGARVTRMCVEATNSEVSKLEKLMEKLTHVNKFRRRSASLEIAELQDPNTIPRLTALLGEEDVVLRRSAAQTLGFIGVEVVPPIAEMLEGDISTVQRATCIKTLSAVAMNFPETRSSFPEQVFGPLEQALNRGDHVSRLSASICLGLLASNATNPETKEDTEPNQKARELLINCINSTVDPGIASAVVMSLGSIAVNGADDDKEMVRGVLEKAKEREVSEDGFEYVREVITSELDKLRTGPTSMPNN